MANKQHRDEDEDEQSHSDTDASTSTKHAKKPRRVPKSNAVLHSLTIPDTRAIRAAMAMTDLANSVPRIDPTIFNMGQQLLNINFVGNDVRNAFSLANRELAQAATQNAAMISKVIDDFQRWQRMIDLTAWSTHLLAGQEIASLNAALKSHAEVVSSLRQTFGTISSLTAAVTDNLNSLVTSILPYIERLQGSERARLLEAFVKVDLWPSPSMSSELIDHIIELIDADRLEEIVPAVQKYYEDDDYSNLKQAIERWWDDPEFIARQHIIDPALQAHCQDMFVLTIPTLIAQTEGIASAYVKINNTPGPPLGSSGRVVTFAVEDASAIAMAGPQGVDILHMVLVGAVIEYVKRVAFGNTSFSTQYAEMREKSDLNRHGILHGIQINYPSAMNSLRCFLLLDAMHEVFSQARAAIVTELEAAEAE